MTTIIVGLMVLIGGLLVLAGVASFVLGELGIGSYRLRKRLPTRSPINLMSYGNLAWFIGFVLIAVSLFIYARMR